MRRRVRRILVPGAIAVALVGTGGVLAAVGLDRAAKIVSIPGALAAVVSLVWLLSNPTESSERERIRRRRRQFARHLCGRLGDLANLEDWEDERYAELEAEVEMEGRQRRRFLRRQRRGLRQVSSLSVALAASDERLILLEGEPGSGKSIALRHVATRLATQAWNGYEDGMVIPIYVNLKTFRPDGPVDATAVRGFVLRSLNPDNVSNVAEFLEEDFNRGVEEGAWLFLFDSFDEIPDVLSSIEADEQVNRYAAAIDAFLGQMSNCHGVIASREFRGPTRLDWPRFRILRLSRQRQRHLVDRALLPRPVEQALLAGLAAADAELRELAQTPLFLGLLCSHMRAGGSFPDSVHDVFARYVDARLKGNEEARRVAEEISFSMSTIPGLGLEPDHDMLVQEVSRLLPTATVEAAIATLQETKLARSAHGGRITFAHRRLQEYFATCVVLRHPDRVSPRQLLTDQNWREAAVTILQTRSLEVAQTLIDKAAELLAVDPPTAARLGGGFPWPEGHLHLLHLLAAGLGARPHWLPEERREAIGDLFRRAWMAGRRYDRVWVLEVVTLADRWEQRSLLRQGFESSSSLLQGEAYRQAGRLARLPDELASHVRKGLVTQLLEGELRRQRAVVHAQVQRLDDSGAVAAALRLLLSLRAIDTLLAGIGALALIWWSSNMPLAMGYVAAIVLSFPMLLTAPHVSLGVPIRRLQVVRRLRTIARRTVGLGPGRESYFGLGIGWRLLLGALGAGAIARSDASVATAAVGGAILALPALWTPAAIEAVSSTRPLRRGELPFLPLTSLRRGLQRAWRDRHGGSRSQGTERGIGVAFRAAYYAAGGVGLIALSGLVTGVVFVVLVLTIHAVTWVGTLGHVNLIERLIEKQDEARQKSEQPAPPDDVSVPEPLRVTTTWLVVLGLLAAVVVLALVIRAAMLVRRDTRAKRWAQAQVGAVQGPLTVEALGTIVNDAHSDNALYELVIALRRSGVVRDSPRAGRFLADLAASAETARRGKVAVSLARGCHSDFTDWVSSPTATRKARRRLLGSITDATIDEITGLVGGLERSFETESARHR